jgi:hypothetical protein
MFLEVRKVARRLLSDAVNVAAREERVDAVAEISTVQR